MDRRTFLGRVALPLLGVSLAAQAGCRGTQTAQVLKPDQKDAVGSHTAGAETWHPLVETTTSNLLSRHAPLSNGTAIPAKARICFIGVENKSAEEVGDFKEQLYEAIDTRIVQSQIFEPVNRRFIDAGLQESRLRPEQLFLPENRARFAAAMQQQGQVFDYLLFAKITSGTTRDNKDYQRDYVLTLEIVDLNSGAYDKEAAEIRKGYNVSLGAKLRHIGPF
jgi:hypothetical protein